MGENLFYNLISSIMTNFDIDEKAVYMHNVRAYMNVL